MKLKYLQTLLLITLLALPVKAQVYLDSAEIAHILHKEDPKAIIVDKEVIAIPMKILMFSLLRSIMTILNRGKRISLPA